VRRAAPGFLDMGVVLGAKAWWGRDVCSIGLELPADLERSPGCRVALRVMECARGGGSCGASSPHRARKV
jgi:hypothetical protein